MSNDLDEALRLANSVHQFGVLTYLPLEGGYDLAEVQLFYPADVFLQLQQYLEGRPMELTYSGAHVISSDDLVRFWMGRT